MDFYVSPSESKPWSVNEIKQEGQGNHNFWIVCPILPSLCVLLLLLFFWFLYVIKCLFTFLKITVVVVILKIFDST